MRRGTDKALAFIGCFDRRTQLIGPVLKFRDTVTFGGYSFPLQPIVPEVPDRLVAMWIFFSSPLGSYRKNE